MCSTPELQNVTNMTDICIRVKMLAGWGKSLEEHAFWQNQAFLGGRFVHIMKDLWA